MYNNAEDGQDLENPILQFSPKHANPRTNMRSPSINEDRKTLMHGQQSQYLTLSYRDKRRQSDSVDTFAKTMTNTIRNARFN